MMVRHVAMFLWRQDAAETTKAAALEGLGTLSAAVPSVRSFTFGTDLGMFPTNWDLVLVADFDDRDGLDAYFAHPRMKEVSDLVTAATESDRTARVQFET